MTEKLEKLTKWSPNKCEQLQVGECQGNQILLQRNVTFQTDIFLRIQLYLSVFKFSCG